MSEAEIVGHELVEPCPHCGGPIRGVPLQTIVEDRLAWSISSACDECGPWTENCGWGELARVDEVTDRFPNRVFTFDEFGPLTIRPHAGEAWAPAGHPDRLPANYHKVHGVRQ